MEDIHRKKLPDAFADPVFIMDRAGRLAELSPSIEAVLGLAPAELTGKALLDLIPEDCREGYRDFVAILLDAGKPARLETMLQGAGEEPVAVEIAAAPIGEGADCLGIQGLIRPMARPQAGSQELLELRRRLKILQEIAESQRSLAGVDSFLLATLCRLITLGRFSAGAMYRKGSQTRMRRVAQAGSATLFPARFSIGGRDSLLPESYLSHPRPFDDGPAACAGGASSRFAAEGLHSVTLPLISHGKLRGVILLAGEQPAALDPDIKSMLRWTGSLLGQSLENLSLREKTNELRVRFKDLTESSADHIWEVDRRGRYIYNSPSLTTALGYRPEDVRGRRPIEFIHPEDQDSVQAYLVSLQKGKKPLRGMINRVINSEGSVVYIESRAFPVFDAAGEVRGYRGVDRNITDWFESKRALENTLVGTCEALSRMVELRDPYTKGHSVRVSELMLLIGREMARSPYELQGLRLMGLLHDIGKVGIPAEILTKPGRLSPEEMELMQQHPSRGYEILKDISFPWPVAGCVLQHHERLDGSGYPQGLAGDEIIWQVRLLSVADLLEAMATDRPYRPGLGIDRALKELELNRGLLYDSEIVDAVLSLRDKGILAELFKANGGGTGVPQESPPEQGVKMLTVEDLGHKPVEHPDYVLLSLSPEE